MSDGASPPRARLVGEIGERALVDRLTTLVPAPPPAVIVGIGDDAAVYEPGRNALQVITTDALVEGVHFERRWTTPLALGRRAASVNLSDLAAMGATPAVAVLSLGLPPELTVAEFDDLVRGAVQACAEHGAALVGGNITRSPASLFLDLTLTGSVHRRRILRRSGARPGDELWVTGAVGAAAMGLRWLQAHVPVTPRRFAESLPGPAGECAASVAAYVAPVPRVRAGRLAARSRSVSAAVDLSDGLADAIAQLTTASHVGAIIQAGEVPVDADARRQAATLGLDPLTVALAGGDDYELLFAVPPRRRRAFLAALAHARPTTVTRIGVTTAAPELVLATEHGPTPLPAGFAHFGVASTLE